MTRTKEPFCWYAMLLTVAGFAAGVPLHAEGSMPQAVQVTETSHLQFTPGGTIRLNDTSGYVSVEAWDRPEVEITVVKSLGYDSEPAAEAQEHLESVQVKTVQTNGELTISTTRSQPKHHVHIPFRGEPDVHVEYRVRAPRNSNVVINHANGFISTIGLTGSIDASSSRGDIVLILPDLAACQIEARTRVGVVTSDVSGDKRRNGLAGQTYSRGDTAMARKLSLKMGFGGITIKELPPEASAPVAGNK
jgi:hypothetical protein